MVVVVVTGATGYLGMHIVKKCVERGYTTRGTIRSANKAEALKSLFPNVELFEADLLKEGSFDKAFQGADYVFHAASPFKLYDVTDPQKELIDPAVQGTINVLASAAKTGSVKRVVLTSSVASVDGTRPDGHIYTENDWNLESLPTGATDEVYSYGKRVAEQSALDFVEKQKPSFDLVVFCPSFIVGPPLSATNDDSLSVQTVRMFFWGVSGGNNVGVVDVRDVAEAQVKAVENQNAHGRYLLASPDSKTDAELMEILVKSGEFANVAFPEEEAPSTVSRKKFSSEKAKQELNLVFTPLETSLVDMGKALISLGIVS